MNDNMMSNHQGKNKLRLPSITEDDRFCIEMEEGFDKFTTFQLDPHSFPTDLTANLEKAK